MNNKSRSNGVPQAERTVRRPAAPDIVDAFTAVDYSMEAALNDLVDNCIDAGARRVLIRFLRTDNDLVSLLVADDGSGMDDFQIDLAMTFGERRNYGTSDLGMFGLGLKSASLSQADVLTVLSRSRGKHPVGRQWTTSLAKANWQLGLLGRAVVANELGRTWPAHFDLSSHGTIVRWDNVRDFARASGAVDRYVSKFLPVLKLHLGLNLHRHLQSGRVKVFIDTENLARGVLGPPAEVLPVDPFAYPYSPLQGYPKPFKVGLPGLGKITAEAHIWSPRSKNPEYRLGGTAARRQGFYFYRNDRLIQGGGWNSFKDASEPHLSLARVRIDLPPASSDYFRVRFTKAGVEAPRSFVEAIRGAVSPDGTSFDEFIRAAQNVYRSRAEPKLPPLVPVTGLPAAITKSISEQLPLSNHEPYQIVWRKLPKTDLFELNRDERVLLVNSLYRPHVAGQRAGSTDGALIRTLLALLLQEQFKAERETQTARQWKVAVSRLLATAARSERGN